jgi:prepilin-type N-terminal cleavage/methylation domain-containing protein
MNGGKNRQPLGYTIVEVLVVLAVSGVMFLIAASFINGKQARSAFTAGINQTASQIQDIIEQVTDGSFSDIPLNCSFSAGNTNPNMAPPGSPTQGTNAQCVFLGKLLRFAPSSSSYTLFSLAGGRVTGASTPTLQPGPSTVDPAIINSLTSTQNVAQSLQVVGMSITDANTGLTYNNNYYDFGFVQGLGTSSGGTYQSGSQTISMVYSPVTSAQADSAINGNLAYAQTITLCLADGVIGVPRTQAARLILGGSGESQLGVDIQRLNPGVACP